MLVPWIFLVKNSRFILSTIHYITEVGSIEEAFEATSELATLRPNDTRISENLRFFTAYIKKHGPLVGHMKRGEGVFDGDLSSPTERDTMMLKYNRLCRGESRKVTPGETSKLKCWYRFDNPLLRLKPQKVERLWVTPEIFMFHDIVTDAQAQWIKETAYPLLQRATIQDPVTGKLTHAEYRVSKSAWLNPREHQDILPIKARTEAAVGLDLDYAEELQIANYGVAGQYEPHFDHARETETAFESLGMGNRIATVLFYISDVTAGGATVFTEAEAAVYPKKNSAVFWFNLRPNGRGDPMTKHAACPVLVGQKWVSNWWIHEHGQELRRRCGLREGD